MRREILSRVFYIKTCKGTGTCFSVIVNGKEFFITAGHVIKGTQKGDNCFFYVDDDWRPLKVASVFNNTIADVGFFTIDHPVVRKTEINLDAEIEQSQEAYFLGFPDTWNVGKEQVHSCIEIGGKKHPYPIPFVKKTIISKMDVGKNKDGSKYTILYLDAIVNKGFSGSPLIVLEDNREIKIVGVVSRYKLEKADIFLPSTGDNKKVNTLKEKALVQTGISIAYTLPLEELKQRAKD